MSRPTPELRWLVRPDGTRTLQQKWIKEGDLNSLIANMLTGDVSGFVSSVADEWREIVEVQEET